MHSNSRHPLKLSALTLFIGVFSGLLTAEAARFLNPANPMLGVVFGAGIIVLLRLQHKCSSARVAVAPLVFSVVSYLAAVWLSLPLSALLDRMIGTDGSFGGPVGAPMFTVAGFIGALIINLTLLQQLSRLSAPQLLGKATRWACGGAFLGYIAAELSGPVGAVVTKLVGDPPSFEMRGNDYYLALFSAYVIWQTGMAFLITWMVPQQSVIGKDQSALDS